MSEIVDANGIVAKIGDDVWFAQGQAGAQELIKGRVLKVNPKTVLISHGGLVLVKETCEYKWVDNYSHTTPRKSKCFVIV